MHKRIIAERLKDRKDIETRKILIWSAALLKKVKSYINNNLNPATNNIVDPRK